MPDASWYEAMYQGRDSTAMPLEPGHFFFSPIPWLPNKAACSTSAAASEIFLPRRATPASLSPESSLTRTQFVLRKNITACAMSSLLSRQSSRKRATRKIRYRDLLRGSRHQDNPRAFLDTAKSFLKDDGLIALSVPNRNRWQIGSDPLDYPPNHLTRWSPVALRNFIERNGFQVLSIREQPLTVRRAARMLSTMFRSGLIAGATGERPPAFLRLGPNASR